MAIVASSASAEFLGHVLTESPFEPTGSESDLPPYARGIAVDDSAGPSHGDLYISDGNKESTGWRSSARPGVSC